MNGHILSHIFLPVLIKVSETGHLIARRHMLWSPHSKETYAMVRAVRKWHVYLAGSKFVIKEKYEKSERKNRTLDYRTRRIRL